jgi:hypothetical protein
MLSHQVGTVLLHQQLSNGWVMMKNYSRIFLLLISLMMTGCGGPSRWADDISLKLACNMSPQEVEKISGRDLVKLEAPREWATHYIRSGSTDLWLIFKDEKLKSVQVAWAEKMMKMASYQRMDLCEK